MKRIGPSKIEAGKKVGKGNICESSGSSTRILKSPVTINSLTVVETRVRRNEIWSISIKNGCE